MEMQFNDAYNANLFFAEEAFVKCMIEWMKEFQRIFTMLWMGSAYVSNDWGGWWLYDCISMPRKMDMPKNTISINMDIHYGIMNMKCYLQMGRVSSNYDEKRKSFYCKRIKQKLRHRLMSYAYALYSFSYRFNFVHILHTLHPSMDLQCPKKKC